MDFIDVSDLPEPLAQAIGTMGETFRRHSPTRRDQDGPTTARPGALSVCHGEVIGGLTREDIYDDDRNLSDPITLYK
jgi:hypothetical protein